MMSVSYALSASLSLQLRFATYVLSIYSHLLFLPSWRNANQGKMSIMIYPYNFGLSPKFRVYTHLIRFFSRHGGMQTGVRWVYNTCMERYNNPDITAIVLTRNNEDTIGFLVRSLRWCDEILVYDDASTDGTVDEAKASGATVIVHTLSDNFAAHRNDALAQASGEWVFFVDSDEEVTKELADEILREIQISNYQGYMLKRQDYFLGKAMRFGETANVRLLRLAKKNAGRWKGTVHEEWNINGKVGELHNPLLHEPHPTISGFLDDINYYSSLVARERIKQGKRVSFWQIVCYPLGKFIQNYFFRQGYSDGMQGAIMAFIMSFHSFLVRGKMYVLQKRKTKKKHA